MPHHLSLFLQHVQIMFSVLCNVLRIEVDFLIYIFLWNHLFHKKMVKYSSILLFYYQYIIFFWSFTLPVQFPLVYRVLEIILYYLLCRLYMYMQPRQSCDCSWWQWLQWWSCFPTSSYIVARASDLMSSSSLLCC